MSADWPEFQLGTRCSVRSSKRIFAREYVEDGIPFFRSKDVIDKSLGSFSTYDLFISKDRYQEIKKTHGSPNKGDLLINSVGNRSGQPYVVQDEGDFYFKDGNILWLSNFEDINSDFLAYWFKSDVGQGSLTSVMIGSAQKALTIDSIKKLWVKFPPYKQQTNIAFILKSLDCKIQLNRQVNQTLEEMAQAIFKSWFVDFEPVKAKIEAKANGQDPERAAMCAISGKTDDELDQLSTNQSKQLAKTAVLFPDYLEASAIGLIPKGWKAGNIGDVATAKGGYAYKSKIFTEVGNPVVKIKNIVGDGTVDLDECQCIDDEQAQATSRFNLSDGDLLMAMTGATVGKVGLVVLSGRTAYLNQRVAKFESSEFGPGISWFLFCAFQRASIFEQVVGTAQGSAQPNISSKGIESTRIVVPEVTCLKKFINDVEPLFSKWISNQEEIKILAALRDTLLPKLLSGEIDLSQEA